MSAAVHTYPLPPHHPGPHLPLPYPPISLVPTIALTRTVSSTQPHAPPSSHPMALHAAPPPLPRSKEEDVEVIVDDDIPNEKFLPCLQKTKSGVGMPPSPLDSIRENIQRSLFSLMPGEHEADAFKRKVETALVALVGEVPMKQLGYPEKTAEQVRLTIIMTYYFDSKRISRFFLPVIS